MVNEQDFSHSSGIPLKYAHDMIRDKAILQLQEQMWRLTREFEWVSGSVPTGQ